MSNDSKNFTLEEKTKIALEAASGDRGKMINLAEKHGVTVEKIEEWIRETGVSNVTTTDADDEESLSIVATEDFAKDYEFGATPDNLNYSRLFFWSIFGTVVILLFIVAVFNVYDYTYDGVNQQNAETSLYYDIDQLEASSKEQLNSFGVVNPEEGIYSIPIDSAITRIAQESE
jgi:hypothetical protein